MNWYVAFTKTRFENRVTKQLSLNGIDSFFPLTTEIRQWSDRKKKIQVPLFPNYVFLRTVRDKVYELSRIDGLVKLLSDDKKNPLIVDENEIFTIKSALAKKPEVTSADIEIGDFVEVIDGPMTGVRGLYSEKNGSHKITIHLTSIDKFIRVKIDTQDVRRITNTTVVFNH